MVSLSLPQSVRLYLEDKQPAGPSQNFVLLFCGSGPALFFLLEANIGPVICSDQWVSNYMPFCIENSCRIYHMSFSWSWSVVTPEDRSPMNLGAQVRYSKHGCAFVHPTHTPHTQPHPAPFHELLVRYLISRIACYYCLTYPDWSNHFVHGKTDSTWSECFIDCNPGHSQKLLKQINKQQKDKRKPTKKNV